jgi:hypothetical protein
MTVILLDDASQALTEISTNVLPIDNFRTEWLSQNASQTASIALNLFGAPAALYSAGSIVLAPLSFMIFDIMSNTNSINAISSIASSPLTVDYITSQSVFSELWQPTVMSQYANSPIILQLIKNFNSYIDQTANIDSFYDNIWNINTAVGYGLDVWGRIVNVSRQLTIPATSDYFGFQDGASDTYPFNQAPFYSGVPASQNYMLSDDAYRTLILIKAMVNIAATNIPTLNKIITSLFSGNGRVYVVDLGNMQMSYVFEFPLQPFQLAVLTQSGVLAHPTGVGVTIRQVITSTFGFAEMGESAQPFNQGVFFSQGEIIVS